jgi:hypothetical protein
MSELVTKLTGEEILGLVGIVGACVTVIIVFGSYNWRMAKVAEIEGQLKREMVSQGRSGEEIAEVIRAKPVPPWAEMVCKNRQPQERGA